MSTSLKEKQDNFTSTLFHELKIPISSINGYLSLLLSGDIGRLSRPQLKVIQKTRELAQYTNELVNNISSIARLKKGEPRSLHYDKVSIAELINKAISTLNSPIKDRSLKIHTKFSRDIGQIWAVATDLEQIIVNILSNAVKFTPKHGHIYISVKTKQGKMCLVVRDTGIGIPKKAQVRLFEDFYRADNVVRQYEGSGLGLAIVKKLLEYNNGCISVSSKLNRGTRVDITLPLLNDNDLFENELGQCIQEASQAKAPFSLLMLVDKRHTSDDGIAQIISDSIRKSDTRHVFENGKYFVILPGSDYSQVRLVCERIGSRLQERAFLEMSRRGRHSDFAVALAFAVFPRDGATKDRLLSYLENEISDSSSLITASKK